VAVDLGPKFVRVVEVDRVGDDTRIARRGTAALPPGCWTDVTANRDAMAASIREALLAAGITARTVVACVPRRLVTVRFARLPHAAPEELRGAIELEAQDYILFPLSEVILDYHAPANIGSGLTATQDDMQIVLLAAARRSLVAEVVSVFDKVGVELTRLSVSALALAEHVRASLEPTAVIALEPGSMDVSVVADGQLLFTRSSALDLHGISPDVSARRFSEEVARSFTAYQNEFRQKPLAHVYLCGSETVEAEGEWLDRALFEALEKPVEHLHSRLLPASDPEARSYAIAAGMALEGLGGALSDINLVPNERAEKKVQAQKARRNVLIGAAVFAGMTTGLFFFWSAVQAQEQKQKATVLANNALDDALKVEKPIQRAHDRIAIFDRVLTKSLDRDHPSVDVLVAINRCMPKSADIWLAQLNFDRGGLMTLRGDSKTSRAVTDLMINLQACGAFTDVKLSYIADSQEQTTPTEVVQAAAPKPAVTTLPGLQPGTANPLAGAANGLVPGGQPGAPGMPNPYGTAGAYPGAFTPGGYNPSGITPGAGAPGSYGAGYPGAYGGANPYGGVNPYGGQGGFPGRRNRGFGGQPGQGGQGNFGGQNGQGGQGNFGGGRRNRGNNGGGNGDANGAGGGSGAFYRRGFGDGAQYAFQPGQNGAPPAPAPVQTLPAPQAPQELRFTPGGGAPTYVAPSGAPGQTSGAAPGRFVITPDGSVSGVAPNAAPNMGAPNMGAPYSGYPNMGGANGGRGGSDPAMIAAWMRARNGVTGGGAPSSVVMGPNGQPIAVPSAPTLAPAVSTAKPAPRKAAATPKGDKPTVTGFVITCRLRRNGKLLPPTAKDAVPSTVPEKSTAPTAPREPIHGATDTTDDTQDNE